MDAKTPALLALACLFISGCAATGASAPPPNDRLLDNAAAPARGLAFAQERCGGCHAVAEGISPNPLAPSFSAVINQPGLTSSTLEPWLRNSHDFPAEMNFAIAPQRISDLAAYMLTLKDPTYKPASQ
ncbi:hypothetical protein [Novosphingobium sp. M1R2S20]|uniref:Cytochrome c domain-containing protein n=1 Tax=Novosphingobium rhizovicinum TaxID=3228928 RepID=A0ABV3R7P3_9SPHN